MRGKISVVVPVYNVEKYLDRCIDSIINQTYKNLEIILVDDGSKDCSGIMCDEYAKKDERIKVIHKANGGLSSARNAGLQVATGKYIGFVDSDDDIDYAMYEKMVRCAEKENVDFVMSDYIRIDKSNSKFLKTLDLDNGRYDKKKIMNAIYPNLIMKECIDYGPLLSVCQCLYRLNLLKKNHINFDEEVRWSEDNIFSSMIGYCADSFYYMKNDGLYHYYQNECTITTSYKKGAWNVYMTMNKHLHTYFDNIYDYDFSRQLKLHVLYYACVCINQASTLDFKNGINEIKEIVCSKELQDTFQSFKLPDVSFKLKLQLYLIKYKFSKLLYYKCRR